MKLGDFSLRALGGEVGERGDARAVIRPERVRVEPYEATGENRVPGMIERVVYLGSSEQLVIRLAIGRGRACVVANDGSPRDSRRAPRCRRTCRQRRSRRAAARAPRRP